MPVYVYDGKAIYEGTDGPDEFLLGAAGQSVFVYGFKGVDYAVGGAFNDSLYGYGGDDYLYGGGGNDLVVGDAGDDVLSGNIDGGPGLILNDMRSDTVYGGAGNDIIFAYSFDNAYGGLDDDTYRVLATADGIPTLVEFASEGTDTIELTGDASAPITSFGLPNNIENLWLFDNVLSAAGNALNNLIFGNQFGTVIDGGAGNDSIYAGDGDDIVQGGTGADLLQGGLGDDQLLGGTGNDQLVGEVGNDTMSGGAGNDFYFAQDTGDVVIENASEGYDEVYAGVSFTLADNIENLFLVGTAIQGTGNGSDNAIIGNAQHNLLSGGAGSDFLNGLDGNDTLVGGSGRDGLMGGAGQDVFRYDNPEPQFGYQQDLIYDFVRGEDQIALNAAAFGFTTIVEGVNFFSSQSFPTLMANTPSLVYFPRSGSLYYDPDGSGPQYLSDLALFSGLPDLHASDFILF